MCPHEATGFELLISIIILQNGRLVVHNERGTYIKHTTINTTKTGSGAVKSTPESSPLDITTNVITAVATTGRDDPTLAEARRADILQSWYPIASSFNAMFLTATLD